MFASDKTLYGIDNSARIIRFLKEWEVIGNISRIDLPGRCYDDFDARLSLVHLLRQI